MSNVRILVGTKKGAFILTADGKREKWDVSGPHFAGWEMYHLKGSPVDPNRIYASQTSGWFGQIIQRSNDGGKTWEVPGGEPEKTPEGFPKGQSNKFAYNTDGPDGKPLTTHQWYDGTQHPWEFKRVWHLEPSLSDPDTVFAGVEDAGLFRTSDGGKTWQELAGLRGHGTGPKWQPGAGGMCLHTIPPTRAGCTSPSLPRARSAPTTAARRGSRSTAACTRSTFPIRTPRSATACTASRCTARGPTCCSCRNTGTSCARTTPATRGARSVGICPPTSGSWSTCTPTSRRPSTSSPSRATPSITCPTGSCACTAAAPAARSGRRSRRGCRSATAT